MACLIMLVGIPGSGKSTFAAKFLSHCTVYSSDAMRKELYGDEAIQGNPKVIFRILHERIRTALETGQTVVYDATNIKAAQRKAFLTSISDIENIDKLCIYMNTPLNACIARQADRDRKVPDKVIIRMFNNLEKPSLDEGWNAIVTDEEGQKNDEIGFIVVSVRNISLSLKQLMNFLPR